MDCRQGEINTRKVIVRYRISKNSFLFNANKINYLGVILAKTLIFDGAFGGDAKTRPVRATIINKKTADNGGFIGII